MSALVERERKVTCRTADAVKAAINALAIGLGVRIEVRYNQRDEHAYLDATESRAPGFDGDVE